MTHLTRCRLNPARARTLTASPQRLHAAIATSFPPAPPGTEAAHRVLWRLDESRTPYRQATLLIVSPTPPDLTHVIEQAGWPRLATPGNPGWDTRPYTRLLDALRPAMRLHFRLTAYPTRSTCRRGQRGHRTPLTTPADQLRWLLDRAPDAGFTIPALPHITHPQHPDHHQVTVLGTQRLDFARQEGDRPGARVRIRAVTYEGHLDVTDPTALAHTLTRGLGRGRAYGCGLLTLAPARPN
ncbi:type I-E CRISPR-associated protein Cas6/Cse3/CasE [Streptomyces sp. NPDC001407]|uniref:type I-E CRISPR-associated protein Cas6/Cse3/CasE n=1 Tax=Streptomyces sp. NPDC001407 TaxID=3364573 RepID=UPI0036C3BA2F